MAISRKKPAKEALEVVATRIDAQIEMIDTETGQATITLLEPRKEPRRRRPRGRNYGTVYLMVDTMSLGMLDLTRPEYRILTHIIAMAPKPDRSQNGDTFHEVEIVAPTAVLARDLGMHPNNVSTVVSRLVKRNILIRTMQGVYRINKKIAHSGSWKTWNREAMDDPEVDWTGEGLVNAMTGEVQ